jgi:TRAP-type C4-dicarboxylate transport system substrate-binding protein
MDFTEVFTALESGIIDGSDISALANNKSMGVYDLPKVKYANYPGFHSMPSDHLACNKTKFDAMPAHHQRIMKVAMESLALRTALTFEKANAEAAAALKEQGVTLSVWSDEEKAKFRQAALSAWGDFATTEEAKALVESHSAYLKQLGLVK